MLKCINWIVICRITNIKGKKSAYEQQLFFFEGQQSSSICENSCRASFQFSALMQYFTFGGSMVPCISPASFNSLKCCETVAFAIGRTSCISPKKHSFLWARKCRIAIRVGCPIAFANLARRSCSDVISNFDILFFCLVFAKLQTIFITSKFYDNFGVSRL